MKKFFIEKSENREQLLFWFYNRLLYAIITTAISGYFNPMNVENYSIKKKKYVQYLQQPIIKKSLEANNGKRLINTTKNNIIANKT